MIYQSPGAVDLMEVRALNTAFLRLLGLDAEAAILLANLPRDLAGRLIGLGERGIRYLADTPFLLFSLRETDDDYWDQVHSDIAGYSLFADRPPECSDRTRLVAAALGFAWQMARQNPYTLRLICCASLHWCERLAEQPIVHVINHATAKTDLLELRAGNDTEIWKKLLIGGLDRRRAVRAAVHYSVLQTLLMMPPQQRQARWKSAACRTRVPALSLSGDN